MIDIIYHDGASAAPDQAAQSGGFAQADGNGEIHCYSWLDGVSAMLMRLEMKSYTELRTQKGLLELNFCANGRFETRFSLRDHVLLKPGDMAISCYDGVHGSRSESHFPLGYYEGICLEVDPERARRWVERNAPAFRVDFSALQQNLLGSCLNGLHHLIIRVIIKDVIQIIMLHLINGEAHSLHNVTHQCFHIAKYLMLKINVNTQFLRLSLHAGRRFQSPCVNLKLLRKIVLGLRDVTKMKPIRVLHIIHTIHRFSNHLLLRLFRLTLVCDSPLLCQRMLPDSQFWLFGQHVDEAGLSYVRASYKGIFRQISLRAHVCS